MDDAKSKRKRIVTVLVLAIICLITGGVLYYLFLYPNRPLGMEGESKLYNAVMISQLYGYTNVGWPDNFVNITVDGKEYTDLTVYDRVKFGLLEESFVEEGVKPVFPSTNKDPNWYKHHFIRGDIGKYIGKVENSNYGFLIGLKVYHYSAYPDSDEICILKLGGKYGYEFYRLEE